MGSEMCIRDRPRRTSSARAETRKDGDIDIFFVRGGFFLPRGGRGFFAAPPRDASGHRRLGGVFLRVAALVVVLDGAAAEIRLVRKSVKRFGV